MSFLELDASDECCVSSKKMDELIKDDSTIFMILSSMKAEGRVTIGELPVVCD